MSNLSELSLLPAYHKGDNDIAAEFYLPVMGRSKYYDRAVGFFSSTIYIIAWNSLKNFVNNGGKMRIICSPVISKADIEAVEEGYIERLERQTSELLEEVKDLFQNPYLHKPARVLAALVALGIIDIKIAFIKDKLDPRHKRIFHDKVGIFTDNENNSVVFKGSMNETYSGLANDGNIESVDVYVTWDGERDRLRVEEEKKYFSSLWKDEYTSTEVIDFPDVVRQELLKDIDTSEWPELVDEIVTELNMGNQLSADIKPGGRKPRPHQTKALLDWIDSGRRGIFEHATGSGKTFTALCAIRDSLQREETPLILVPSELLLKQWAEEVRTTFEDLEPQVLLCGGGNTRWKQNNLLSAWSKKSAKPRIIIAMLQTASSEQFLASIRQGEHLFIVADEVHRMGSNQNRNIFKLNSGPRLGLSATPRRAGDPEGTQAIFNYFNGVIPPPFTLQDAIKSRALTRYMYFVHSIELTDQEQEQWDLITNRIKKAYAINSSQQVQDNNLENRLKNMLIERARVIKSAQRKVEIAVRIISENFQEGQRWIVYCDSQTQLNDVLTALNLNGFNAMEYHSSMQGDKEQTLKFFEMNGGIVVSIRCLDEGVDIPAVSHALILASSKNPREFIQRRGRVLRRSSGKLLSFIHDVVVRPNIRSIQDNDSLNLIESEIARAIEFGEGAENPSSIYELRRILLHLGLDYKSISEKGFEDDEE
ncbi:DEAD/DEAH box helicase family protein [Mesobacillus jeotgali]|uniref:DEAD/DEAH box helicase family protein n=1 Tax=Mesobacillus jeotgali TaxID=129985 RepID=UPI00178721CD|nr:DEAD/DEAH box helicase family protein [Mesobacillus jeotgali]UYZ22029.1 DEAD/DEAH box helicase family protein [Mesobacillus jeotgali]